MSRLEERAVSTWPYERKCPECKKKFVVPMTGMWGYKAGEMLLCSWSCVRAREKKAQEKAASAEAKRIKKLTPLQKEGLVRRYVFLGLDNDAISRKTGFSMQLVNYYRRRIEEECTDE